MNKVYKLTLEVEDGELIAEWTIAIVPLDDNDSSTVPDFEVRMTKTGANFPRSPALEVGNEVCEEIRRHHRDQD